MRQRNYDPRKENGRELNAPSSVAPRSALERSTKSRARLGACLVRFSPSKFAVFRRDRSLSYAKSVWIWLHNHLLGVFVTEAIRFDKVLFAGANDKVSRNARVKDTHGLGPSGSASPIEQAQSPEPLDILPSEPRLGDMDDGARVYGNVFEMPGDDRFHVTQSWNKR